VTYITEKKFDSVMDKELFLIIHLMNFNKELGNENIQNEGVFEPCCFVMVYSRKIYHSLSERILPKKMKSKSK
jgi:hypothetical protein